MRENHLQNCYHFSAKNTSERERNVDRQVGSKRKPTAGSGRKDSTIQKERARKRKRDGEEKRKRRERERQIQKEDKREVQAKRHAGTIDKLRKVFTVLNSIEAKSFYKSSEPIMMQAFSTVFINFENM